MPPATLTWAKLERSHRVDGGDVVVAEQPDSVDHHVDVAVVGGDPGQQRPVRRSVNGVERADVDGHAVAAQPVGRRGPGGDVPAAQHDRARRRAEQLAHDRQPDVARPAEQHDRLRFTE
ncbi:MAG: hypothetical protein QM733_17115 [Ilumatobacteraceae bacterium]